LTETCELKGREWDQRSSLRLAEIDALGQALTIIKDEVKPNDESANKRAVGPNELPPAGLATRSARVSKISPKAALVAQRAQVTRASMQKASSSGEIAEDNDVGSFAFLQKRSMTQKDMRHRINKISHNLAVHAKKMGNVALVQFAARLSEGPFEKVKQLIQTLIERLVKEATDEATHKGWCDSELGKAKKQRDYRHQDVTRLNAEVERNEAVRDTAHANVLSLKESIVDTQKEATEAQMLRDDEKRANAKTIREATAGYKAVMAAHKLLKEFYQGKTSANVGGANSASYELIQQTPMEQDMQDGGHEIRGAYQGNQAQATPILGMLKVIATDFERTKKNTMEDDFQSDRAYAKYVTETQGFLSGAETDLKNNQETLDTAVEDIRVGKEDMKTNMDLVDGAIQELEELTPACVDTGMSYADRVAKRDEEIAALKTALCQLDPDGVEAMCE